MALLMKLTLTLSFLLFICTLEINDVAADELTGQYLATGNFATENAITPSMNNKLTGHYAPIRTLLNLDLRIEQYVENSYHAVNNRLVREHKFEAQFNLNYPITKELTATGGLLRHENYTFTDNYYWAVAGLVWSGDIATNTNLTTGLLMEKRTSGGRLFFDGSATLEHRFEEKFGAFASAHIYENFGEFDISPTHKREYEVGVNYYYSPRYVFGVSYFDHQQVDDANDRFKFLKLRAGINF